MDENGNINDVGSTELKVEPPVVPTQSQEKLRRRYGRMTGWYGAFALLFLSLSVYNVVKGLNTFASLPMFIELGLGIAFVIPAFWAYRRRARLDANVAEGSTVMPRHLKTWQHMLLVLIIVPAGLFAVSWLVVTLLVTATVPSEEEIRSQEISRIRELVNQAMDDFDQTSISNFCVNMADPGKRGNLRQSLGRAAADKSVIYLSQDEVAQIQFETFLAYCGLSQ